MQINDETKKRIIDIVKSVDNASGKVNLKPLASIGKHLKNEGIDYKELGFPKLNLLLENLDMFEIVNEYVNGLPVKYVSVKNNIHNKHRNNESQYDLWTHFTFDDYDYLDEALNKYVIDKPKYSRSSNDGNKYQLELLDYAYIDKEKINDLADLALKEKWYFGDNPPDGFKYPILFNYLCYTYSRLKKENKIFEVSNSKNEKFAFFNTGLVNVHYEYIYAEFTPNTVLGKQPWYLDGFCSTGTYKGKILSELFSNNELPPPADYFENNINNMILKEPNNIQCDFNHMIIERTERLPFKFIYNNVNNIIDTHIDGMDLKEAYGCNDDYEKRKNYFRELGNRIKNNDSIYSKMSNSFQEAVRVSEKRSKWNYKTAIPYYYPNKNKMCFLLPLSLVDNTRVDTTLVVEKMKNGNCIGHTILTMEMAYKNSRLIIKPDSDWLQTEKISDF